MVNGHSSNRNLSMGGYSSYGSTSWIRVKSKFPLETDRLSFDESLMDNSGWVHMTGMFDFDNGTTDNEISSPAIIDGPMESLDYRLNEAETSEASFPAEAGCSKSRLTPEQRVKKRIYDGNYRQKLEEKERVLQGLVPGCKRVKGKEAMLDEIINYVRSFQQAIEVGEKNAAAWIAEIEHLKEEIERLNAENTMLKEQTRLLPSSGKQLEHQSVSLQDHHVSISEAVDKDHHGTNSEAVDRVWHIVLHLCIGLEISNASTGIHLWTSIGLNHIKVFIKLGMDQVNATSLMSGGGVILSTANPLQSETVSATKFSSFTSVGLMQGAQGILEVNGVKLVSGVEAQLNATEAPGDASLQDQEISLKKRKRSEQVDDVDQAKGGQPLNMETKDSVENQDQGVWNLTTTTNKSTGKQGSQGSQASDPPEEENIYISAQIAQTTISDSVAEKVRRERFKEKLRFLQGLVPGCSKVTGSPSMLDEVINYVQSLQRQVEIPSMKLAASRPTSNGDEVISDILLKLDAHYERNGNYFSDFDGLYGERKKIDKYSFPISLHPIVNKIIDVYGDVSTISQTNPIFVESMYIYFCASVKEMSDHRLEQVTEGLILKWRDVIKDALSMNFKVDFAMKHLKKIAYGYIGLMEHSKILELEAQLSATKERTKIFMDVAEDFCGKPVSSGMFPDEQATRV